MSDSDVIRKALDIAHSYNCYFDTDPGVFGDVLESLAYNRLLRTPATVEDIEAAARASYEASGPKPVPWEATPEDFKRCYRRDVAVILNTYINGATNA